MSDSIAAFSFASTAEKSLAWTTPAISNNRTTINFAMRILL
jgi:hypothetical protein